MGRVEAILWLPLSAIGRVIYLVVRCFLPAGWLKFMEQSDTVLRHRAALEAIKQVKGPQKGMTTVLDIGAGGLGMSQYLDSTDFYTVVLDKDFGSMSQIGGGNYAVCGDGCALPFRDASFDFVVSVHCLEHIHYYRKEAYVSEVKRVAARAVVIVGPSGEHGYRLSRQFIRTLRLLGLRVPRAALEHLEAGIPDNEWLKAEFFGCRLVPRRNLYAELVTLLLSHIPVLHLLSGAIYYLYLRGVDKKPPFVESVLVWQKKT